MTEPDTGQIRATSGPFEVSEVPLYRRNRVLDEEGQALTWNAGERIETEETYWLCRCGQSATKPFCDGSHNRVGFAAGDSPDSSYRERATEVAAAGIEVADDRSICAHASFCATKFTNVWKQASEARSSEVRTRLMSAIDNCPSGALTYALDGEPLEQLLPQAIAITDDGPLWVTGGVPVTTADGEKLETRNRVTLCRCGASANKPLCDGAHSRVGFKDS
jgi:CDGSH-type Zn-finger protein